MYEIREQIRELGHKLGFAKIGFAPTAPLKHQEEFKAWLKNGFAGQMDYMDRYSETRNDPRSLLPSAQSAIVGLMQYANFEQDTVLHEYGKIARYARGKDYHIVIKDRLEKLVTQMQKLFTEKIEKRILVDTAPILERELAMAAGLGFIGKNTMLISPGIGSYTVIGILLVSLNIPIDTPSKPRCGKCDLCIKACPTKALVDPYVLDARRCISYLTIEYKGAIPSDLSEKTNGWIFGCDECQQICPYNSPKAMSQLLPFDPELCPPDKQNSLDLTKLINLRSGEYKRLVKQRAFARTPRPSFCRNATIAMSNVLTVPTTRKV